MRITFLGPINTTYCSREIGFLRQHHTVMPVNSLVGRGATAAWNLLVLMLRMTFEVLRSDAIFCWFADYHTAWPTFLCWLLGKKSFIVVAGFDVGYLPEINYGARTRPVRWFCVRTTLKYASHLLPVSGFTLWQIDNAQPKRKGQSKIIYLCSDSSQYPADVGIQRGPATLTVSQADNWTEYIRKGSDRFIRIARLVPEVTFYLAGLRGKALELAMKDADGIPNVKVLPGPVDYITGIVPLFMACSSYCQLSIEEAGATAVTEAILAGMYAVVTDGSGMTELVLDKGGKAVHTDEEIAAAIRYAVTLGPDDNRKIAAFGERFSVQTRSRQVLEALAS